MTGTSTEIFHYAGVIAGEVLAALVLAIILFAMLTYREHRKSSNYLFLAIAGEFLFLLGDAASFCNLSIRTLPIWLTSITYFASYTFGILVLIPFSLYSKAFIEEKTSVRKWTYVIPVLIAAIDFLITVTAIISGSVYGVVDGKMAEIGGAPAIVSLLQLAAIVYLPIVAFTKKKQIGLKAVMLLGLFGIMPFILILVNYDYTGIGSAMALLIVYVLLQCDTSAEKEKQRKALTAANEEKLAQIEEITALNAQLEENQAQLEEAAAEQEAQVEEITALNSELEERQAQLEESSAEQEAQIEDIKELNRNLTVIRDRLNHDLNIIGSVSQFFTALFYVNLSTYGYTEINPTDVQSISQIAGTTGDARVTFKTICEKLIEDEYQQEFSVFTDVTTLEDRLENQRAISMQFFGKTQGWQEGSFIAAERDSDGRCTFVIWVVRSINEQKEKDLLYQSELEKARDFAEAANNAKTSFLFNMSHDIRTPMNAIMGFRDLLEKHQEDPERRADYLKKIEESSNVLLSIINNVLEMARIEKGTVEIDESAWSAEQFNDTLYSIFQEMMSEKGITFTRQIDVEHPYVYCDPIKLREVFINILSNAYKYTNAGGSVNMHLEEIPSDREGYAMYQTTITDTGIGMSEEFLPHIFEEFSRERNTTDNKVEGTGLGMPIVKRLLDFMEGSIEIKSTQGVGSTFIVTIPHKITEKSSLVEHAGVEIDPKLFVGKRILLAEDNDLNAEIAVEILGEAGFIIDRAEDGAVCCEKIFDAENNYYDLILMDIQMPNMNGYDTTRTIRKMQDSAKANIPILAMTANAFEEDKREALRAGMNGHLAKPINVTELMKALAGILG